MTLNRFDILRMLDEAKGGFMYQLAFKFLLEKDDQVEKQQLVEFIRKSSSVLAIIVFCDLKMSGACAVNLKEQTIMLFLDTLLSVHTVLGIVENLVITVDDDNDKPSYREFPVEALVTRI